MIERRGEHKMFISPQSLKMPSLFKPPPSPKPSTNSALQRLPTTSPKPHKSPHHFVIAPRPTTHYLCFKKKPNQPCSQTQCFSIPPAKPKHLVVVGYTPKIPTANISTKLTPTKRKSSASPKIPFLCH